jgi:rhamnogalacturonan acetylesterase
MRRFLLFAAVLLASVTLHAQVTTPDAPYQTSLARNPPLNPALPSVFIVGDSMARNGSDLGWGDHFAPLFAISRINVANRTVAAEARAPVSTKDAGRLFWLN